MTSIDIVENNELNGQGYRPCTKRKLLQQSCAFTAIPADKACSGPSQMQCIQMPISLMSSSSANNMREDQNFVVNTAFPDHNKGSKLLRLARSFNNFYFSGYQSKEYRPLFCQGHHMGLVSRDVEVELLNFQDVFVIHSDRIDLCPGVTGYEEISAQVASVLRLLREKNIFIALKSWRNETYDIRPHYGQPPLFAMERAATCIFGLRQYGVDVNGYVVQDDGSLSVWMQRRAKTKPTWPGSLDNFTAGGLSTGYSIRDTVIKETEEEANLPKHLAENMEPAGCVGIFFQSERGLFPNTEFVFDIQLPKDFVPTNNDGEVDEFMLVPASEIVDKICDPQMKTTSTPVTLDFLVRKGIVNLENEPDLPELIELLHIPVHSLYK